MTSGLLGALRRWWYLALVGVLASVALAALAARVAAPSYHARASVLLVPPVTSRDPNPYLGLGGLQEVADVLSRAITDSATADLLRSQGATGTYDAIRDQNTDGPILDVQATAKSGPAAVHTLRLVIAELGPTFSEMQRSVSGRGAAMLTLSTLTVDKKATVDRKTQIRVVVVAAAGGLLLTLLIVAGVENLATRRRRRADRDHAPRGGDGTPGPEVRRTPDAAGDGRPGRTEVTRSPASALARSQRGSRG